VSRAWPNRDRNLAVRLGTRIRRARLLARRRQRDVAAAVGVSQPTICRMELGRGGGVPLRTWIRVAGEVGLDWTVTFPADARPRSHEIQLRCHGLVADLASAGGWSAWTRTTDDPSDTETILERPERNEVAIVRVWDVLGDVEAAVDDFRRRVAEEGTRRGAGCTVGGIVVIAWSAETRRRLTEAGRPVQLAMSLRGDEWIAALGKVRVPLPDGIGLIWTDQRIRRLRSLVTYVDFRRRQRAPCRS
jgi:transcriptional regulator with XRE-family HTH domain